MSSKLKDVAETKESCPKGRLEERRGGNVGVVRGVIETSRQLSYRVDESERECQPLMKTKCKRSQSSTMKRMC